MIQINKNQQNIEEILNSLSHGIAAIVSTIGCILLIINCNSNQEWALFSAIIYGLSLIILYTSSALYHSVNNKELKHIFRILDHCSIFFLIAGTYTPVLLISIGGKIGWCMFAIQSVFVLVGCIFKFFYTGRYEGISILMYILMGWMIIIKWDYLVNTISNSAFNLLISGGSMYTIGVLFYLLDEKIKYFHFIWHLFVIAGSMLHYIMIYQYVLN